MKQLNFTKNDSNLGHVEGILRVYGKLCFFQFNNSEYANGLITNLRSKGAVITPGRKWIRANIFGENKEVKIGEDQFNVDEKSENEIEDILIGFFSLKYTQAGFTCIVKEINSSDTDSPISAA